MGSNTGSSTGNRIKGIIGLIFALIVLSAFVDTVSSNPSSADIQVCAGLFVLLIIFAILSNIKQVVTGRRGGQPRMEHTQVVMPQQPVQNPTVPTATFIASPPPPQQVPSAAIPSPPSQPPAPSHNKSYDFSAALRDLDSLHKDGLISDSEYYQKRSKILEKDW
jgi:hypothetical protein